MSMFVYENTAPHTCGFYRCPNQATARIEEWDRGDHYGTTHLCPEHMSIALGSSHVGA